MKYLVAGLGNIGPEYEITRHNIGFLILDQLADKFKTNFELSRHAYATVIKHKSRSIHLIKPTTYMNLSGKALHYWKNELKVPTARSLVVTDDVALPLAKLRMRAKGSSAGHNGLKSIEESLGSLEYPRLRFGIGNDYPKGQQIDYVLSRFTPQEIETIEPVLAKACDMVLGFCSIGIERTMNLYND